LIEVVASPISNKFDSILLAFLSGAFKNKFCLLFGAAVAAMLVLVVIVVPTHMSVFNEKRMFLSRSSQPLDGNAKKESEIHVV